MKIVFILAFIALCYAELILPMSYGIETLDIKFSVAKVFEAKENELTDDSGVESVSDLAQKLEFQSLENTQEKNNSFSKN